MMGKHGIHTGNTLLLESVRDGNFKEKRSSTGNLIVKIEIYFIQFLDIFESSSSRKISIYPGTLKFSLKTQPDNPWKNVLRVFHRDNFLFHLFQNGTLNFDFFLYILKYPCTIFFCHDLSRSSRNLFFTMSQIRSP